MSTKLQDVSRMVTADTFTGKRVVDREGVLYGKVKHIHINPDALKVTGVTIREGFQREYFLPETYIDKFTKKTLLLSTSPIRTHISVVDIDGNKIGKIKKLHKNSQTDELESIEVTNGVFGTKIVSKSEILGVGDKVTLRGTKEEFKKLE
jgi:sporulation protein YlmC with PRC-barrel domain